MKPTGHFPAFFCGMLVVAIIAAILNLATVDRYVIKGVHLTVAATFCQEHGIQALYIDNGWVQSSNTFQFDKLRITKVRCGNRAIFEIPAMAYEED